MENYSQPLHHHILADSTCTSHSELGVGEEAVAPGKIKKCQYLKLDDHRTIIIIKNVSGLLHSSDAGYIYSVVGNCTANFTFSLEQNVREVMIPLTTSVRYIN